MGHAAMTTQNPADDPNENEQPGERSLTRRGTLGLLGVSGLGLLAGQASAQPPADGPGRPGGPVYDWKRDVDAGGHGLSALGSLAMSANSTPIADFEGSNLSIDADGVLNATVDAARSPWTDSNDDGLFETDSAGIDVGTVDTENLSVANVGASVFLSDPFVIAEGDQQLITYDEKKFDHKDEFDLETHQFTATDDGFYQIDASVLLSRFSGGGDPIDGRIRILVNGELIGQGTSYQGNDFFSAHQSFSRLVQLASGDTVEAHAMVNNQLGGSTINYNVGADATGRYTVMTIYRVG